LFSCNTSHIFQAYDETFTSFIVEFANQWERDVVGSVTKSLEQSEDLRREVDHYQAKVQSLQNERPSLFGKSKEPDPKDVEKLARNKGKLADARALYESHVQELCSVIEEVTDRAWKNMVPILAKLGQSDQSLATNEYKCMSKLEAITTAIKNVGYGTNVGGDDLDAPTLPDLTEDKPSTEDFDSSHEKPSPRLKDEQNPPPMTVPSLPPPTVPSSPPPTAPWESPTSVPPPATPTSLPSETDPEIKKASEGIVDVSLEDNTKVEETVVTPGEETSTEALADETKNQSVGTSFSPRSYMI